MAWGIFTAFPVSDPETGQLSGAVVTFLDITERKHLEEQLQVARIAGQWADRGEGIEPAAPWMADRLGDVPAHRDAAGRWLEPQMPVKMMKGMTIDRSGACLRLTARPAPRRAVRPIPRRNPSS